MAKAHVNYRCTECGWTAAKWVGRCGECQAWGTVEESVAPTGVLRALTPVTIGAARTARAITDIETEAAGDGRAASASSTGCSAAASCRVRPSC